MIIHDCVGISSNVIAYLDADNQVVWLDIREREVIAKQRRLNCRNPVRPGATVKYL